jgi:glycosyltransferase involved in cell wall biosynthesis
MTQGLTATSSLNVLHVLRAPLGGLFRHVVDLAREQAERGHKVGLIVDSLTEDARARRALEELEPRLALGLKRLPIARNPAFSDLSNMLRISRHAAARQPDVIHGHGSKGGLYARASGLLPGTKNAIRVYTPHGGSLNYLPDRPISRVYMAIERLLARNTDAALFESQYACDRYEARVTDLAERLRVVWNGISEAEFTPVLPNADAADFVYVGEMRAAKGVDTLIEALGLLTLRTGREVRAILVGNGPDLPMLRDLAHTYGLDKQVSFPGAMGARDAFALGRTLVVPSRAESLPYIVLEAVGAQIPIITTNVGGVPEIFGPYGDRLVPPGDVEILSARLIAESEKSEDQRSREAAELAAYVRARFTITEMVDSIIASYYDAMRRRGRFNTLPSVSSTAGAAP